jgi:hypothetical protein
MCYSLWKTVCYNFGRLTPFSPSLVFGSWADSSPSWGVYRTEFGSVSFELNATPALVDCSSFLSNDSYIPILMTLRCCDLVLIDYRHLGFVSYRKIIPHLLSTLLLQILLAKAPSSNSFVNSPHSTPTANKFQLASLDILILENPLSSIHYEIKRCAQLRQFLGKRKSGSTLHL